MAAASEKELIRQVQKGSLEAYGEIVRSADTLGSTLVRNPFRPGPAAELPHDLTEVRISQTTRLPAGPDPRRRILADHVDR